MSIRELIRDRVTGGRLTQLTPMLPSSPIERLMLASREVTDAFKLEDGSQLDPVRAARLRADLDAFVEGEHVTVAHRPDEKHTSAYMARLKPVERELWCIRSRDPKPGVRVLGRFAEKDCFIALAWAIRKDLQTHAHWSAFAIRAEQTWDDLFPNERPHRGETTGEYLSSAFSDC